MKRGSGTISAEQALQVHEQVSLRRPPQTAVDTSFCSWLVVLARSMETVFLLLVYAVGTIKVAASSGQSSWCHPALVFKQTLLQHRQCNTDPPFVQKVEHC